ncbi:hypothetical protein GCM10009722_07210 [Williamsia deligens]|nr:hypothetical protein [Williamsia deligens]
MSDKHSDDAPMQESAWERRRRLARIFGDDLPSVTADEATLTKSDGDHDGAGSGSERWYRENKPPHHE